MIHFVGWFLLFALITFPFQSNNHLQTLIEGIPIICVIAFISSYREVRGKIRGILKAHNVWVNFYENQVSTINQTDKIGSLPNLDYTQHDSLYYKVKSVIISLFREPIPLFLHFGIWSIGSFTGIYLDDPMQADILDGMPMYRMLEDLISEYWDNILFILPIILSTCLLEVRGYVFGIRKKHKDNINWLNRYINGIKVNETLELPPFETGTVAISSITSSISRYLILQLGLGILLYLSISMILGFIGIVDNPNFFFRYLLIALFLII